MTGYLFVGEHPSRTAHAKGWTWTDGRLAAKPLFEALEAVGVPSEERDFINLFGDQPRREDDLVPVRVAMVWNWHAQGMRVVAMGRRVERALKAAGVPHVYIPHPAARGRIRKRERYIEAVKTALGGPGGQLQGDPQAQGAHCRADRAHGRGR